MMGRKEKSVEAAAKQGIHMFSAPRISPIKQSNLQNMAFPDSSKVCPPTESEYHTKNVLISNIIYSISIDELVIGHKIIFFIESKNDAFWTVLVTLFVQIPSKMFIIRV